MIPFYTYYVLFIKYFKIISSFFFKSEGENKFVKSVNFLPDNIKSTNPMEKYPHITESFACIRKMLDIMFLLCKVRSIIVQISLGICSKPKLWK